MKNYTVFAWFVVLLMLPGCGDSGPKSAKGFTLPTGVVSRGEEVFRKYRCYDCHLMSGVEFPVAEEPGQVMVQLGGEVGRIKTYGELVTSVINPSHRLAKGYATNFVADSKGDSRMTNYNEVLTVRELCDLVAFLQSKYKLLEYDPTTYPLYY